MKKIVYVVLLICVSLFVVRPLEAETKSSSGDVCKVRCRSYEGLICLERGPCEPINKFLLEAAKECREDPTARYLPITKLLFVDILSQIIRLDKEFAESIDKLEDKERYALETRLLKDKGIDIFAGTKPLSPLTREELAAVLKDAAIEKDLGFSTGLANQIFDLKNEEFIVYDLELYVDEGKSFELWERKKTFEKSSPDSEHYVAKLDSCDDAMVTFGDNKKGKIPPVGSRVRTAYKFYGREGEIVTECEIAMLMSEPNVARAVKDAYNPSRPLTKANFADLLIRTRHLEKQLPRGFQNLSNREMYSMQTELLARHGIAIFTGSSPEDFLTREELARILYDCPVEEVVGMSDGTKNQNFELSNAGFVIYDLHTYVDEGKGYENWDRQDSFIGSSSESEDYLVKLDAGNYTTILFGDGGKGKIPAIDSPVKARYRLYAPLTMLTEDDIVCMLGRCVPVVEAYEPPPAPFEFPDPTDGFKDPASHI